MKITDIELHEIHPPLQEFNCRAIQLHAGGGYDTRTIVVLHTDNGLEGLGDVGGPPDARLEEEVEQLRGTNPCRWLAHPDRRGRGRGLQPPFRLGLLVRRRLGRVRRAVGADRARNRGRPGLRRPTCATQ